MTKAEALYTFWNSFGLDAYPTSAVPENETFPYLTYENTIGEDVSITVALWYHTDSEAIPNAKVEEISSKIGRGGIQIACDNGSIWIKKGNPFSNASSDAQDPQIKKRTLNVNLTFN